MVNGVFPTGGMREKPPPLARNLFAYPPTRKKLPNRRSPSPLLFLCYNPIKTLFLAVIIAPVPFLFSLYSLCTVNFVHYIMILIDVQYLQKGQNSLSDCHRLIKKSLSKISHFSHWDRFFLYPYYMVLGDRQV